MNSQVLSNRTSASNVREFVPALSAMLIGFVMVLIVGFAPVPEVHNAAHDTRHSAAFPCH